MHIVFDIILDGTADLFHYEILCNVSHRFFGCPGEEMDLILILKNNLYSLHPATKPL
jgi:hypothetical protein